MIKFKFYIFYQKLIYHRLISLRTKTHIYVDIFYYMSYLPQRESEKFLIINL